MTRNLVLACGALIAITTSSVLADPPGCVPVFAPITITAPGNYCVTRDITSAVAPIVAIQADDVNLDLNRYTLHVTASSGAVIEIDGAAGSTGTVRVETGTLRGGAHGVQSFPGSPRSVHLESVSVQMTASHGIFLQDGRRVTVHECVVSSAGADGVWISGFSGLSADLHLWANRVIDPLNSGIEIRDPSFASIVGNTVSGFGAAAGNHPGIRLKTGRGTTQFDLAGNTVIDGGGDDEGVRVGVGYGRSTIFGNNVAGNGSHGFYVESGTPRVAENHVTNNGGNGMIISGQRATIENNTLADNGFYGLTCGGLQDHLYTRNVFRGNASGSVDPAGCEFSTDAGDNFY